MGAVPRVPRPAAERAVDVYRIGWIGDYVDAINFLELWTCDSGNNNTNYCDKEYDALVEEARQTPDNAARYEIYDQLEENLFGPDGELPIIADLLVHVPEPRETRRSRRRSTSTSSTRSTSKVVVRGRERSSAEGDAEATARRGAGAPTAQNEARTETEDGFTTTEDGPVVARGGPRAPP